MQIDLGEPTEKQKLFLLDRHKNVGFGGARGGGKSHAIRLKSILACLKYPHFRVVIVRLTYPELIENHIKPLREILRCGSDNAVARYNDSRKEFTFPNGSQIICMYCASDRDLAHFQGLQTDYLFLDEATNFTEEQYKQMTAIVRGTNGYPKRIYTTANPGGVGMGWYKRLYIDKRYEEGEDPSDYSFIQSLVTDNKYLNEDYVKQLMALPPKIREKWLYGNWDCYDGIFFESFRTTPDPMKCHDAGISTETALAEHRWTHVIKPFDPPQNWRRYRSYDFGFGKPFSCAWWVCDESGVAYRILECYGCTNTPNEGLKWTPEQQMQRFAEIERTHPWLKGHQVRGVADPAIWEGSHGVSVAEIADKNGLWFSQGVNDRVPGWMQVQQRLHFDDDGYAMMYFFENCKAIIRTMPLMMYDEHRPEDLDSDLEDHACDEVRYFCMSRPLKAKPETKEDLTFVDPLDIGVERKKGLMIGGRYV